jgi:CDP-glycerol glycerophosphotransferase
LSLRKKRRPEVRRLAVERSGQTLDLHLVLGDGVSAHAVTGYRTDTEAWVRLADLDPAAREHRLTVPLAPLAGPAGGPPAPGGEPPAPAGDPADPAGGTALLYLEVERQVKTGSDRAAELARYPGAVLTADGRGTTARYRTWVGRAGRTVVGDLGPVEVAGQRLTPYVSRRGVLSVAVDRDLPPFGDVYVRRLRGGGGVLRMRGRICTRHAVLEGAELLLKGRTSGLRAVRPIELRADTRRSQRRKGQHWYRYTVAGDWAQLLSEDLLTDDIYDAWASLRLAGQPDPHLVRIGKTRFAARQLTRPSWAHVGGRAAAITPYYTFKALRTSFQVDLFDRDTMNYMRRQLARRLLSRITRRGRPVWLIGERPDKCQDTGLALFRHLREHHREIDAYYVLDHRSPERANAEGLDHVLEHRSREHIRLSLLADKVLGSHHPDFLYPVRTPGYRRAMRATRIFLQHGVMGTKWMVPNYGKGRGGFETDLFVVSSEREKEYIVSDFGYHPDEVTVTGLSRFDTLFADDVPPRRQLLIMPTWRDWLQDTDTYPDSEYHERWSGLLHNPRLHALAERNGLDVVLCLHPNMRMHEALFQDTPARVINQGEVDIQRLLKESTALVTDYSSVGFDFSFLGKPVVYYQFDRAKFLGPRGSHLDLDVELPGAIAMAPDLLLEELESLAQNDFAMPDRYRERADRFIAHRDRRSSERIVQAARAARRARLTPRTVLTRPVVAAGLRYWRRSRVYVPMMKLMFRALQKLPADQSTVVFESGVGKQFADSPRYIYEELVRRGSPLRKVWAYNGKLHTADERTEVVERLSPGYYWHLGRARYWVNNQNFPFYFTRRPDGVYLQTWHGTPLKRMLHDLDTVHGRDDGYLDRVTVASRQWSVLASPSPFATERMRSAFRYPGEVIEVGYPRNDVLLGPGRAGLAAAVRRRLGVAAGARVVLYAPTFRDDQSRGRGRFSFTMPFDLTAFHQRFGADTVLLLRMHVLITSGLQIPAECAGSVLDVSTYPEIQELFLASDALVTDYSSVFFDYAALRRPMVFYAHDLESYRDDLRGFYLDYEHDLPGPVVTTQGQLFDVLADLDGAQQAHKARYDAFLERFAPHDDGQASRRVVDAVFGPKAGGR